MPTLIDNVELDETNIEFNYALDFIKHRTDKLIYLTGKAGTGKTTFLKYLHSTTDKNIVILAPTGVAAINARGQTIHSFFQLPFGPFIPDDKRLRTSKGLGDIDDTTIYKTFRYSEEKRLIIEKLELLVIDEISMVRCDTLDVIDRILKVFRKKPNLPFGGVQVVLIGDTFQLPPIADNEQWEILKEHYESPFFFSSETILENKPIYIELKKIYRQKEQEFIDLLNKIRINQINDTELNILNDKYNSTFSSNGIDSYIILATTNAQVNQTNATKLNELNSELKIFEGEIIGTFSKDSRGNYVLPTEQNLHLKEGAQVMFLKNDNTEFKKYYNGKIGKIASLSENKITVEFSDLTSVQVEKASWNNVQYTWNKEKGKIEEKTVGTFTQYPLKLAWAITVHKSQGLTFERVFADLGSAFEDGQVYVALSRCTSFGGLVLKSKIPRSKIRTSQKVLEFAKTETPSTLIVQELNSGKADFYYKQSRDAFKELDFNNAYDNFIKAIKFRNDIETDNFKKYFATIASRITPNKKFAGELSTENTTLLATNNELKISVSKQQKQINEQNEALKLLLDRIKELEKTNEKSEQQISTLRNELKLVTDNLNLLKTKADKQEIKIKEQENTINSQEKEIERVQNLKWHQKLFGEK